MERRTLRGRNVAGPDELATGEQVGPYLVNGLLGRGGFSSVYAATHEGLLVPRALKVPLHDLPSLLARVQREGRTQARLRHANLVPVHDVVAWRGRPVLVLDRVFGVPLGAVLAQNALDSTAVDDLANQILSGVAHAHHQGVVHRDLKPGNVLVEVCRRERDTGSGLLGLWARVTDFGLLKQVDRDVAATDLTGHHRVLGTPAYMSPEQVGAARAVDKRSDVWSLGCLLYEMLTGERAFPAATVHQVFADIEVGNHRPLTDFGLELPSRMVEAIEACLAVDPARRPADAGELWVRWFEGDAPTDAVWPVPLLSQVLRGQPVEALQRAPEQPDTWSLLGADDSVEPPSSEARVGTVRTVTPGPPLPREVGTLVPRPRREPRPPLRVRRRVGRNPVVRTLEDLDDHLRDILRLLRQPSPAPPELVPAEPARALGTLGSWVRDFAISGAVFGLVATSLDALATGHTRRWLANVVLVLAMALLLAPILRASTQLRATHPVVMALAGPLLGAVAGTLLGAPVGALELGALGAMCAGPRWLTYLVARTRNEPTWFAVILANLWLPVPLIWFLSLSPVPL